MGIQGHISVMDTITVSNHPVCNPFSHKNNA